LLEEESQVSRVACPRHHKARSGLPHSCSMRWWAPRYTCKEIEKMSKWSVQLVPCSAQWNCSCCALHFLFQRLNQTRSQ